MNRQKISLILSIGIAAVLVLLINGPTALPALAQPAGPEGKGSFPVRPGEFPLQNITSLVAGADHTCALIEGGVKCWGSNSVGQLGDGSGVLQLSPVAVAGLSSDVTRIAAGWYHTCAAMAGGGVKCWGYNDGGQLGDGTFTNRPTPIDVSGLSSGITALAAGAVHTCALTNSGGVKCWGDNYYGQLGDGTRIDSLTPVDVTGLSSGVIALTAGWIHTCALTDGGGVKCWGENDGQLGDGTYTSRPAPVDVVGLSSGVSAIAAGERHTCALISGGAVKCWGLNGYGQLGDGTTLGWTTPTNVIGLSSGAVGLTAGYWHTCAVIAGGGVKCWGANGEGQLGDSTSTNRSVPVQVTGLSSGVTALTGGGTHTCAQLGGGQAKCWGNNYFGQLGNNRRDIQPIPVTVIGLKNDAIRVSAGGTHTCAVVENRSARCWGNNASGQLGDGTRTSRPSPVPVSGLSNVITVATGGSHTCALLTGGTVKCWGSNTYGQLGDGTQTDRLTPVTVSGLSQAIDVTTGGDHSCALISGGGLKCWGKNWTSQLGNGTSFNIYPIPTDVVGLSSGVNMVTAGGYHTCAVITGGAAKCWGDNSWYQLGDGSSTGRPTPVAVYGLSSGVSAVAAGEDHTCALLQSGGVKCWGDFVYGETLRTGSSEKVFSPTPVDIPGLSNIIGLTAGANHDCALTAGGGVKCWADNFFGQLGDGSLTTGVRVVEAGGRHTCALLSTREIRCWGDNFFGQLGNGEVNYYPTPVDVVLSLPVARLPGLVTP